MTVVVLLDAGPLGLVTNPKSSSEGLACRRWIRSLLQSGVQILVPEITDYEVRRELLRVGKVESIERLDALAAETDYLPLTTATMRRAAELWAEARRRGRPTADAQALDGDVILAAQASLIAEGGDDVVIATMNVGHLEQFVAARRWQDITAE